jgi:homoserine O-acetyltransferase
MSLKFLNIDKSFGLESGLLLDKLTIAYHTWGHQQFDNVIWVCHAFSGNSNPMDWWPGLFGSGKCYDPKRHFIVCANIIGSCYGSTNPMSINPLTNQPYGLNFPLFTIRDMVKAHILLRDYLNIKKIKILIGPSLGGFQALEWAFMEPEVIENLVAVATQAAHSPWSIAQNQTQRMALEADCSWGRIEEKAAQNGLKAARAIAMLSYRSYEGYNLTQRELDEKTDHFKASSYQQYQGEKFCKRFNAYSYWYLTKAMDSHNLGRNRGGLTQALSSLKTKTHILAINSDRLYPVCESEFMAQHIPNANLEIFDSEFGHDGFLVATEKIATYLLNHNLI